MDKLLFYSLNSKGLPNGPNFNRTAMLGKLSMFKHGGPHDPTPPVAEERRLDPVVFVDGGQIMTPGDGWQYQQTEDEILTKKEGATDWIVASGAPKAAIEKKIFGKVDTQAPPPEQQIKVTEPNNQNEVVQLQQKLVNAGYNLGNYGVNKDGIDGILGKKTQSALDAYNKGVSAVDYKEQDTKMQDEILDGSYKSKPKTHNYVTNIQEYLNSKGFDIGVDGVMGPKTKAALDDYQESGKFATLPVFPTTNPREETCRNSGDGYGCAAQVSLKEGELFGSTSMENAQQALWANDAWFNKSHVEKNGGTILYETDVRGSKMQQLPKEVYGILQVGDYVHLDRRNTPTSWKYEGQEKEGLENEKVEHVGMIIGKDTDGTPLIWHSSNTGKAYIKRVDEPITLDDHKMLGAYQISSIARSGKMKDQFQNEVRQNPYFIDIDKDNELLTLDGATEHEKTAVKAMNDNLGTFKNLGYEQEDVNKVGQLLVGIMGMETDRGTSTDGLLGGYGPSKTDFKTLAATLTKEIFQFDSDTPLVGKYGKKFEGDEASEGLYQMKINYNFSDPEMAKDLKSVGLTPDNVMDSEENETKAATIIMLNNYDRLKKDSNYNSQTDTWTIIGDDGRKWEYPASYILSGAWSAGSGWQNRKKYRDMLTSTEGRTYSQKVLDNMSGRVTTEKGENYGKNAMEAVQAQNKKAYKENIDTAILNTDDEFYKPPSYLTAQSESTATQRPLFTNTKYNQLALND